MGATFQIFLQNRLWFPISSLDGTVYEGHGQCDEFARFQKTYPIINRIIHSTRITFKILLYCSYLKKAMMWMRRYVSVAPPTVSASLVLEMTPSDEPCC